jgi:hypothetical protein
VFDRDVCSGENNTRLTPEKQTARKLLVLNGARLEEC